MRTVAGMQQPRPRFRWGAFLAAALSALASAAIGGWFDCEPRRHVVTAPANFASKAPGLP